MYVWGANGGGEGVKMPFFYYMDELYVTVQHKGLDTVSQEVASAVSHAVQDQLRTLIEQLSLFVTHRLENYRVSS